MKNVVLVTQDRKDITDEQRKKIVQAILKDGKYQIILMVVNKYANKEEYSCYDGVKKVIDSYELEFFESMEGIDYKDVAEHKNWQLDIENSAYRFYGDYNLGKYYYYSAFSFWNSFFSIYKPDIIIHTKAYHGFAYDCCDILAKKYGAKSVHFFPNGYNNTFGIYVHKRIVPVFCGNVESLEYFLESSYDKTKLPPSVEKKNFCQRLLYKFGGNLLEDFATRLVKWNWKSRSIDRKRKEVFWSDKFIGYMKLMSIKRYMESLSCVPDFKAKYIVYFLHVEPEASIQINTILESQLVAIKMLSEVLPKGWLLYVKEHPAQYDVNNDPGYYHMIDMCRFKTKDFYYKLTSMENVKLVKMETKSQCLIEYSQAVSSILGTVFFEAVQKNKPVIMFSDQNPIAYAKDAFVVDSFESLKSFIDNIKSGIQLEYSDVNAIISKYVFKGEYLAENIVELLNKEC